MFADSKNQFESFVRLDASHNTRKRANRTAFRARGNKPCRRRRRVLATIARTTVQIENAHLALELVDCAEHDGNAMQCTNVINQVAGFVVIGTIDN